MEPSIGADDCQGEKTGREEHHRMQGRALRLLRGVGRLSLPILYCFLASWLLFWLLWVFSIHGESAWAGIPVSAGFAAGLALLFGIARALLYISDLLTGVRAPTTAAPAGRENLSGLARKKRVEWRKAWEDGRRIMEAVLRFGLWACGVFAVLCFAWVLLGGSVKKYVVVPYDAYTCKQNLQADLEEVLGPTKDPTVAKCSGNSTKATCLVRSLEDGIYKTNPMIVDCSRRWTRTGAREKAGTSAKATRDWDAQLVRFFDAVKSAE